MFVLFKFSVIGSRYGIPPFIMSGSTSGWLLEALRSNRIQRRNGGVVILVGVNDILTVSSPCSVTVIFQGEKMFQA